MRFLGPHSAGEGPHLVPISLKIGSPLGPHFDKVGSPWHVATVQKLRMALLMGRDLKLRISEVKDGIVDG